MLIALSLVLPLLSAAPEKDVCRARELEARASELQRSGKYKDAEEPLKAALSIWTKHYGPNHIEVLNDEMNLAVSYRRRGDAALSSSSSVS